MLIKMHFSALSVLNELLFECMQSPATQQMATQALRNSPEQAFSITIAYRPSQNRETKIRPQANRVKVWKQPQNHLSSGVDVNKHFCLA